jgi:hypothetical protein
MQLNIKSETEKRTRTVITVFKSFQKIQVRCRIYDALKYVQEKFIFWTVTARKMKENKNILHSTQLLCWDKYW